MGTKKFRIGTNHIISQGLSDGSFIDCDDFDEFVEILRQQRIAKFSLKSRSPFDDVPDFYKTDLTPNNIAKEDFDWLTIKSSGSHFLEIDLISKQPIPSPKIPLMHDTLMPFTEEQVKKYFNKDSTKDHLEYFKKSIKDKYLIYEGAKDTTSADAFRQLRQAEKDERFFTTRFFVALFEDANTAFKLKTLLIRAFGIFPPTEKYKKNRSGWDVLLRPELKLTLEKDFSAPKQYLQHLSQNLYKRHFVPYVMEKGTKPDSTYRKDLEGATQVDAYIEAADSLRIFIEAKYTSDISHDVSYDLTRNQIARTIDVMLEDDKDNSLFLLLTPKLFKDHPTSRFYGYKMNDYMTNPLTLMADLHHRYNLEPNEWKVITERIGWITWEDMDDLGLNLPTLKDYQRSK